MTRLELLTFYKDTCYVCFTLLDKKNKDYSNRDDNALRNFHACEQLGVPAAQGVLVRMSDKLMRISNLLKKGEAEIKTESIEDTIHDIINYCVILKAIHRESVAKEEVPAGQS